jgi:CHAD domain-containing protein
VSFRIRPDAAVRKNVRRLVGRELGRALAALDEPDALGLEETVHGVRKRCTRVRGVLRLARPGLGAEYARANAEVRDAARELSALRDAHATLATFDGLVASTHGERADAEGLREVRQALARRADAAGGGDAARALAAAAERLAAVDDRVGRWSPDDDVAILLEGLARNYAQGRRAARGARADPTAEAFHEWRKRAKYGWYHVRLLHPVAPSALGPLAKRLKDLSDGLGDEHDLAVLRLAIAAAPGDFGGGTDAAVALIEAVRRDLQDRCHRLGARVYVERPQAFADRVGGYWSAWRALGRERPVGTIDALAGEPADRPPGAAQLLGASR